MSGLLSFLIDSFIALIERGETQQVSITTDLRDESFARKYLFNLSVKLFSCAENEIRLCFEFPRWFLYGAVDGNAWKMLFERCVMHLSDDTR